MGKSELCDELCKLLRFGAVGGSGLAIDMGLTWFFKDFCGFNPYASHVTGFLCAAGSNYMLNKHWTFKEPGRISDAQFGCFIAVSFVGLVLSTCTLSVLYSHINLNFYLSKFISVGMVSVWNYLINRYWVFNGQAKNHGAILFRFDHRSC